MILLDKLHALADRLGLSPKIFDPVVVAIALALGNFVLTGTFDFTPVQAAVAALIATGVGVAAPVVPGVSLEEVQVELGSTGRRRVAQKRARRHR